MIYFYKILFADNIIFYYTKSSTNAAVSPTTHFLTKLVSERRKASQTHITQAGFTPAGV